ncbi:TPA: GTP pyrophosphokinase family protein [Streptococcus suis]
MNKVNTLMNEYDLKKQNYEKFVQYMETTIKSILDNKNISVHSINSRVKEAKSLEEKIERKAKYKELSDITDICGMRIISYFSDDVDNIAKIIEDEFEVDKINSIDKRKTEDPSKFGYVSLHYVVNLKDERANLPECEAFRDMKIEIQVRTILQHAWAEIEHDLGYKSEGDIPEHVRRSFSRLSGLIELADEEFVKIKEVLNEYFKEVTQQLDSEQNGKIFKIDTTSLNALIDNEMFINEIQNKCTHRIINVRKPGKNFRNLNISKIVEYSSKLGIGTIEELKEIVLDNFDDWLNTVPDNYFYFWITTPILQILKDKDVSQ